FPGLSPHLAGELGAEPDRLPSFATPLCACPGCGEPPGFLEIAAARGHDPRALAAVASGEEQRARGCRPVLPPLLPQRFDNRPRLPAQRVERALAAGRCPPVAQTWFR